MGEIVYDLLAPMKEDGIKGEDEDDKYVKVYKKEVQLLTSADDLVHINSLTVVPSIANPDMLQKEIDRGKHTNIY